MSMCEQSPSAVRRAQLRRFPRLFHNFIFPM
jgi:hypothetical protein